MSAVLRTTSSGSTGAGGWPIWLATAAAVLLMVLFWGTIIVGAYFLIRALTQSGGRMAQIESERPLDVLKRRYAAGEITREEYERMRRDLEQ